jgi:Sucrase/ferredoxin-like
MAAAIKSFLQNARQTISGASTPTSSTPPNLRPIQDLFTKVNPAVDGYDCDHDCESCEVKLPKWYKINEDDYLYGHVKGWSTHLLVATGKTDWVRDVEDEKGSIMQAIGKSNIKPNNGVSDIIYTRYSHKVYQTCVPLSC